MLRVFLSLEFVIVLSASVFNRRPTVQPKLRQLLEDSWPTSTLISLCQRLSWKELLLDLLNSKEVIEFQIPTQLLLHNSPAEFTFTFSRYKSLAGFQK